MDQFKKSLEEPNLPDESSQIPPGALADDAGAADGTAPEAVADGDPRQDARTTLVYEFLADVLTCMKMDVEVKLRRPRADSTDDEIRLEIIGHDAGRVIGKKGQVLAALQYLVNRVANKPGQARRHVVIDAEGYRQRREDSLALMARRLSAQAVQEGKIITFEPMSPRDRRVVHLALAKIPDVVTRSDGEGENRRVRIIPVRKPS